jgi:hypothetical protein
VALIIALIGFLREPQFKSRTLVEVQAPMFAGASQDARLAASLPMLMETQKAIVGSVAVAGDRAPDLRVEVVPQTFLLALHYRAGDAETARSGASAVAQAYVDFTASSQVEEMRRAASLLIARLDSLTRLPEPSQPDVGDVEPPLVALSADPLQDLIPPACPRPRFTADSCGGWCSATSGRWLSRRWCWPRASSGAAVSISLPMCPPVWRDPLRAVCP